MLVSDTIIAQVVPAFEIHETACNCAAPALFNSMAVFVFPHTFVWQGHRCP
jgi:hypothetical protein